MWTRRRWLGVLALALLAALAVPLAMPSNGNERVTEEIFYQLIYCKTVEDVDVILGLPTLIRTGYSGTVQARMSWPSAMGEIVGNDDRYETRTYVGRPGKNSMRPVIRLVIRKGRGATSCEYEEEYSPTLPGKLIDWIQKKLGRQPQRLVKPPTYYSYPPITLFTSNDRADRVAIYSCPGAGS
jgi:hypothetical protein